jgi:LPXTG-motif cell wall-anchored protein
MENDGVDQPGGNGGVNPNAQDGNNGSGNDVDCEDDNRGKGVPGHCKEKSADEAPAETSGDTTTDILEEITVIIEGSTTENVTEIIEQITVIIQGSSGQSVTEMIEQITVIIEGSSIENPSEAIEAITLAIEAHHTDDSTTTGGVDDANTGAEILGVSAEAPSDKSGAGNVGAEAQGTGPAGATADEVAGVSAEAETAEAYRAATGFLPNTGAAANMALLGTLGLALVILGGVALRRRRTNA